ncbi:phage holin, lambda family [Aeromonas enteropelogenes]|uniref:phage holin, lambda family n=1 Tax=Aeromonas enteropelogenes TaxID=29489 RepID=UPI003BA02352
MPYRAPLLDLIASWLASHWPTTYTIALAALTAWLRITYNGGAGRRRTLELLLCGLLGAPVVPLMSVIGLPPEAGGFFGAMIGLIGVDAIRDAAASLLKKKAS